MKTKNFFLLTISLLLITGVGCENKQEPTFEIYENREASACGIKDPLKNIDWIKDYCTKHSKSFLETMYIYKNKVENTDYIVIETSTEYDSSRSPSSVQTTSVYSCKGELILFYGTEGQKPSNWDKFFQENEVKSKLWSVKQ